ncbi:MAG: PTS fructose transporter subunit IIA [Burkholderiaceae bacterium]|jgi:PTS system ascorbate-specific IIA component|uniref:PTS sugar transporter subunit IIA n=1 Tax=Polynucleobacter sp. MWH-Loch1C5 TaxID=2689108 RepID=UPI001C0CC793|nr:PTS fructose transporter subunit IIA [Polynucleobacter sp. MWH-Loch1C5]MBU3542583.1 PTS fructose transporter subunit IIA [Polynucleobacter sp. MWH-Loch1C5]NBU99991.1 PTS fructose transporter subunit IIA [Burkholderiaceae bacterium]
MAGILLIAHAPLASALKDFARHVYGEVPDRIESLDVMAHEDAKVTLEKAKTIASAIHTGNGLIILTDIMGATPANVATKLAHLPEYEGRVRVLAGVNLPMLMRAIAYRAEPLDTAIQKAMHGGQQGIIPIGHLNQTVDNSNT